VVIFYFLLLFGMPDSRVAEQAIRGFIARGVIHFGRDRFVAIKAATPGHVAVERRDLDRLGEIPKREGGAVAKTVQAFDGIFGDD
jgi:hypothetical protein